MLARYRLHLLRAEMERVRTEERGLSDWAVPILGLPDDEALRPSINATYRMGRLTLMCQVNGILGARAQHLPPWGHWIGRLRWWWWNR
jgi:hypothetical protein